MRGHNTSRRTGPVNTRRESPERERQRHYKARAGATNKLGELIAEHGEDMSDELRRELLDVQDALNPKTDEV